jgi:hypothetical protein
MNINSAEDKELVIKLIGLLELHNAKQDAKEAERAKRPRKKKTEKIESAPIEDPIKSDITKMLEKPKKRRKPKEDPDEYGEIDDKIENAVPTPYVKPATEPQTFLEPEKETIKQTITEKPIKERPQASKLFKEDLLMTIDPTERVKAIESTKNALLANTAQPLKEDEAKRNISNFLTTYSKNKKY